MEQKQHFLITRFNVKVNYDSARKGIDMDWLSHRFDLFEKFCYPSVYAQTNSNFQWIVYFDSETPEVFKEKIHKFQDWKAFLPIYISTEFSDQINCKIIASFIREDTKYLITTRMDNDDAISSNFIQLIQENFEGQEFEFLSFPNGLVLSAGRLYSLRYVNNPFISLVERIKPELMYGFRTILCGEHSQLSTLGNIKKINTYPSWLQVVHGKNVSNRIRGIRQPIRKLSEICFAVDINELPQQDFLLLYWFDKIWSLSKQPIEFVNQHFPPMLKSKIKKFLR
jgi:hypothetical protein